MSDTTTDQIMQNGIYQPAQCDTDFSHMASGLLIAAVSRSAPASVPAAVRLRDQFDSRFPARSKASDGWIGDQAHASRTSYHNPDQNGWVHARDITHDPAHGMDIAKITDQLAASRDPRILELIANGWYLGPGTNWGWVKYNGSNPHNHHFHITVRPGPTAMDTRPWQLPIFGGGPFPAPSPAPAPSTSTLKRGDTDATTGGKISKLQKALRIAINGQFDADTEYWVRYYQRSHNLTVDGIVGQQTLNTLGLKL